MATAATGIVRLRHVVAPRARGYVGWPLWFVGQAFVHTRRAGALLVLGLLLNGFIPIRLPWL